MSAMSSDQWAQWYAKWEEAAWNFTYTDETVKEQFVLQGGLVAVFYIADAAQPHKRRALAEVMLQFHHRYGMHLKWGTFGSKVRVRDYTAALFSECVQWVTDEDMDGSVEFTWSSGGGLDFVGAYEVAAFSAPYWKENVHNTVSYLSIYLPVEILKSDGRDEFCRWMQECAALVQPLNGYAGLGFQRCYEANRYENLEFEHALEFNGMEVGDPLGQKVLRQGFKSINWLTFVSSGMLEPLGWKAGLKERTAEVNQLLRVQAEKKGIEADRITLHEYDGGVMVQAGEWPQLGWVEREPFPTTYVAANYLLRPARTPELRGIHMGSMVGEVRFTEHTANEWLRRFDGAEREVLGLNVAS